MKKVQNFFSYARVSELPTIRIFELFDLNDSGKDVAPYKIDYSFSKDILSECELGAYARFASFGSLPPLLWESSPICRSSCRVHLRRCSGRCKSCRVS